MSKVSGSVRMEIESQPRFVCRLTHGPSGTTLQTEAPLDNGGTGGSFSPTDLFSVSLAACALTTMQLAASREGLTWGTASAILEKRMSASPRRVGELALELRMPAGMLPAERARLEEVGRTCPVALSLSPQVRVTLTFVYPD
jgi:putative redox protein